MTLPTKTNLETMDYSYGGVPFVSVATKSGITFGGMEYSFFGAPFWGAEVAATPPAGAVKIVPTVGTIKLYSSVGIQSTAGRLGL